MIALFVVVLLLTVRSLAQVTTTSTFSILSVMSANGTSSTSLSTPSDVPLVVQGEAISAHFTNAGLVPSLFANFTPSALLSVSYGGLGTVSPGQNLSLDQIKSEPTISVIALNSSVSLSGVYTLAMIDAGIVGDNQSNGQMRHWLVNGVTINGNSINFSNATNITDYVGPNPPEGEGAHRWKLVDFYFSYVFVLFAQPKSFTPSNDLATPGQPLGPMDITQYINNTGLGPLMAGMYFDAQKGISTVTVSPTSPVITSTLPGFSIPSSSPTNTVAIPTKVRGKNAGFKQTYSASLVFALWTSLLFLMY
ncbi:hypothetical protein Clacol_006235 [Clathrus columnatus]|uniref:PEBP-like protein n=1 Tax=Clathrus columnatus TaxID=1419009 RepID=A0AAV5AEC9_9AGAM|nr:hypothetical protein Clacol_006235 [Clathrus columnatus]